MVRLLVFSLDLSITACLLAQYTTSTLGVTAMDPSGAAVANANITVRNLDTGLERVSTSGDNGAFIFTALPVGRYEVTVEKPGFRTFIQQGITLTVDQPASLPVRLQIGSVQEQITVAADAQLINTESGTVGQVINSKKIVDLPLDGRQPQTLLFLAAGTVNETGNYCLVNCQGGVYPRRAGRQRERGRAARRELPNGRRRP